jgi:hypothetical protein
MEVTMSSGAHVDVSGRLKRSRLLLLVALATFGVVSGPSR